MRPASKHPAVQQYFSDLSAAAADLPESQREALLGDAVEQLDRSLANARTDGDVATVLASFADPKQVVAATSALVQADATEPLPTGALGLYLGIVGMVFVFFPWIGIGIGVVGLVVSVATLFRRRARGAGPGVTIGGIGASLVAIALPLILMAVIDNFQQDQENPTPNTITVN